MNYWILTTEYPPLYGGGISTYCYHTAMMLVQKGHKVSVFIPGDETRDYDVMHEGPVRIIKFNGNRSNMAASLGHVSRISFEFAAILKLFIRKEGKPDCIESQEYLALPYYLLQYKLLRYPEFKNVPVLLTIHSPAFLYLYYNREGIYEFPNYWTGEMEISCLQCADHIIAPSRYIIEEIKKHCYIDESKVSVIHNPYEFANDVDGPLQIERDKIIFYGKLSPQKGVFELFSYLKSMWDDGFPYGLTVIGGMDKVYYPEMKTMGQVIQSKYASYIRQGLVHFVGKISPQKRDEYLAGAHVILIPSLNDNLPYAATEAMSIGKTVLASIQGGQAEMITDGENGFLFDHNHPQSFAEKLQHILSLDNETITDIGIRASETIAERLNYKVIYHQKFPVIEKLIANKTERKIFPFARTIGTVPSLNGDQHTKGLLTVVIPYYNMGAYIDECIDSVLQSSFTNMEILIINDGSTDKASINALKKWEANPFITIIHKANGGIASVRNHGAMMARGEWLAFIDADDKVRSEYYNKAISVLKQYSNVSFVGSWVQFFGAKKNIWPTWNPEPPYILLHNSVNSSALVYKTEAYLSGGIHDKAVDYGLEDYGSVISMLAHGYRGVVLPECLFFYRIRNDSMYRSLTRHKALYSYQYLSAKHSELYSRFAPELFSLLNANGPSFAYDNPSFGIKVTSRNELPNGLMNNLKMFVKKNPALKRSLLMLKAILKIG